MFKEGEQTDTRRSDGCVPHQRQLRALGAVVAEQHVRVRAVRQSGVHAVVFVAMAAWVWRQVREGRQRVPHVHRPVVLHHDEHCLRAVEIEQAHHLRSHVAVSQRSGRAALQARARGRRVVGQVVQGQRFERG